MFAPNGLGVRIPTRVAAGLSDGEEADESTLTREVAPIGQGYFQIQSRLRVTRDGGHSILAVPDPDSSTRLGRVRTQSTTGSSEGTTNVESDDDKRVDGDQVSMPEWRVKSSSQPSPPAAQPIRPRSAPIYVPRPLRKAASAVPHLYSDAESPDGQADSWVGDYFSSG